MPGTTPFTETPTLVGDLVELRPFTSDAPATAAVLADPEVVRVTGSATTTAATREPTPLGTLVEWYGSRAEQDDRLDLAIVDRASGEVVGEVVVSQWDPDNASANVRTLVGPAGRSRSRARHGGCPAGARHAFTVVGLHRVELEVHDFNPRARRVYEKVGFRHEGTRRGALSFDGQWVDAHVMAVLASDRAGPGDAISPA